MSEEGEWAPARRDAPPHQRALDQRALLERLRAGEHLAFEEMVRRYGPRLMAMARRVVRGEEDARDCVQEAFLAAHRSVHSLRDPSSLGSWLGRIVVNAALMKLRAQRSRPEESIETLLPGYDRFGFREGPLRTNSLTPEELLQRVDCAKLVRGAIDALPDSHRMVLVLRDIEGYDTRETAKLMSVSEGAVKVRLHRARNALKEQLRPLFHEDLIS